MIEKSKSENFRIISLPFYFMYAPIFIPRENKFLIPDKSLFQKKSQNN